jgi:hypothetical protein
MNFGKRGWGRRELKIKTALAAVSYPYLATLERKSLTWFISSCM